MTDNGVQPIKARLPLSAQARQYLLDLIDSGTYAPGEQLPSENELAAQLGISRPTLREALRDLESEGAVVRKHGVGTFITAGYEHRLESGLERLESVLALATRQGMEIECHNLQVEEELATPEIAAKLQIPAGSPLTSVSRVIVVDRKPSAFMLDVVPASILALADVDCSFNGSVLDLLKQKHDLSAAWAVADIVALDADALLSAKLGVLPGRALLLLEEMLFSGEATPLEFSRNYFIPDRFRFQIVRR
jgi:GntR family transcriptional regulator